MQEICDRTALATGKGLGELSAQRFPRRRRPVLVVLMVALVCANALNVTADLVAVGSGMHLLHAGPAWVWALLAGVGITVLVVSGSFRVIEQVFKVFTLALLAYVVVVVVIDTHWRTVLAATVVPDLRWDADHISMLVAVLGTTISPYLFFWQTGHRVEDMREEGPTERPEPLDERSSGDAAAKELTSRIDVFGGFLFSNLIMWAIIVATAQTLGRHGQHDIQSAAQAAEALRPIAGSYASTLFALGFIGSGMLAVPVLAGSGAIGLSGLLGKRWGFSRSPDKAPVFYGIVAVGTLGGTLLTLIHVNPIRLLVVSALINGLAAAPFLIVVMLVSGDRRIMGEHRNGTLASVIGWVTVAVMAAAAVALVVTSL